MMEMCTFMTNKQTFLRGTFILTGAAFITRILGFLNSIILARFLGPEGIGLLMMAHPLVPMMITLTSLGLPVAISKLVAEAEAQGDTAKIRRILKVSLSITVSISIVLVLTAFFGAKPIASLILADQRAYYAMLALIPIAPLVAVSAVLKGYFRGRQNMKPIAFSDVIENTVQIVLIAALVQLLLPRGIEYAAAGAMLASVMGEGAGLLYLTLTYSAYKRKAAAAQSSSPESAPAAGGKRKRTLYELLQIGLPTTGQGFIESIYHGLQPLLVTKSLTVAGIGAAAATKQYGLLVGYAFPLLVFPTFIVHSLSSALVPAISEANAGRNAQLIHQRMDQAIRIAFMIGAPCTFILYMWAEQLTGLIYHAPEAGLLIKILAPVFLLHYLEAPLHAILLGLGKVKTLMWNFIMATLLKAIAIFIFGSEWGIYGVALGINFGTCLIAFLNFFALSGYIGFYLDLRQYVKAGLCLVAMAFAGQGAFAFLHGAGYDMLWVLAGSIGVSLAVYLASALASGAIQLGNKDGPGRTIISKI